MGQLAPTGSHKALETREALEVHRSRVLVADADTETRASIAGALSREGYEVLEFEDGVDLTEYVVDYLMRPDLYTPEAIVASVDLPGISGLGILGGVRSFDGETPFVLVAHSAGPLTDEACRLGATIVYRPFDVDVLVALVRAAIHQRMGARSVY